MKVSVIMTVLNEGAAMRAGLQQLQAIGRWAEGQGYQLAIRPIRRYRRRGSDQEISEDKPGNIPAL